MTLVAISAMHGRPAISQAWAEHTASLGLYRVVVSVTSGDRENIDICRAHKFVVIEVPNEPLAAKFNVACRKAMDLGASRLMILPSDDFVSRAWVDEGENNTSPYIYPHCCGTVCAQTGRAYVIEKLSFGTMRYGAGRVVSRKVVDACGGQLWPDGLGRGLDGASHQRITRAGFPITVVKTEGIPITDVKTSENLWPFQTWVNSGREIKNEEALHMVNFDVYSRLFPR